MEDKAVLGLCIYVKFLFSKEQSHYEKKLKIIHYSLGNAVTFRTRKRNDKLCACAVALLEQRFCIENRTFIRLLICAVCNYEYFRRRFKRQMEQKENDAHMRPYCCTQHSRCTYSCKNRQPYALACI